MTRFGPEALRDRLGSGLLSFPVTHATDDFALDLDGYRDHVAWLADHEPAGFFVGGGTGEFFALPRTDIGAVVAAAVESTPAGLPVVAPAGYGTADAIDLARVAERAGADGLFLLPPYLTEASDAGLVAHVRAVCEATELGVIVYHRANARFSARGVLELAESCPNFIGFKDGIGDLELLIRLHSTIGDRLVYISGLYTAETTALPYFAAGAKTYSSAIFNFAPRWARGFYDAVRERDRDAVAAALREFVLPYIAIRDRSPGYAVSIVKAGLRAAGRPAGPVRPPLRDLTPEEFAELEPLVQLVARRDGL